jgi:hypothetical protein
MVESSDCASAGLASRPQPLGFTAGSRRSTTIDRWEFVVSAREYGSVTSLVTTSSGAGT